MGPHVLSQSVDPLGQNRDLDLGGTRVIGTLAMLFDQRGLLLFRDRHGTLKLQLLVENFGA
jgi:hypothetical protein